MTTLQTWLQETCTTVFPFRESARLTVLDGQEFPNSVLADLSVAIPTTGISAWIKLSDCSITDTIASVILSVGDTPVLTLSTAIENTRDFKPLKLRSLQDGYAGYICFGPGIEHARGHWSFLSGSELTGKCVRVLPSMIYSLGVLGQEAVADGDVVLAGDAVGGLTFTAHEQALTAELTDKGIAAVKAASDCNKPYVKTINGVTPDTEGRVLVRFL